MASNEDVDEFFITGQFLKGFGGKIELLQNKRIG
jgi:hypothetical protein